ncbi:MAG: hypothetical protein OXN89_10415 [Bryobacterales bacterium]|nr:hypothetical protein [Bryobacterales bacterium]
MRHTSVRTGNRLSGFMLDGPLAGVICSALAIAGAIGCSSDRATQIELIPKYFDLRPGETVRYAPMLREPSGALESAEAFEFESDDPSILVVEPRTGLVRAIAEGAAELLVRAGAAERRFKVTIRGTKLAPIKAVHHSEVQTIDGEDLLFVGHANRDGFDHTAVAKAGIDDWVRKSKASGRTVVFWVSDEYPNWYGADRQPDIAIVSEGQEHTILVEADRVVFTGGDFMFCTLRNVQMTLQTLLRAGRQDSLHYVFPPEAIWMADIWGTGDKSPYPAPTVLLGDVWYRHQSDLERYRAVILPFLQRLFGEYPVEDYPADAPPPDLERLIADWRVDIVVGDSVARTYRGAASTKTILLEFLAPRDLSGRS